MRAYRLKLFRPYIRIPNRKRSISQPTNNNPRRAVNHHDNAPPTRGRKIRRLASLFLVALPIAGVGVFGSASAGSSSPVLAGSLQANCAGGIDSGSVSLVAGDNFGDDIIVRVRQNGSLVGDEFAIVYPGTSASVPGGITSQLSASANITGQFSLATGELASTFTFNVNPATGCSTDPPTTTTIPSGTDQTTPWEGNGSENLPCSSGSTLWIWTGLGNDADLVSDVTLSVNGGEPVAMERVGNNFKLLVAGPGTDAENTTAEVSWTWNGEGPAPTPVLTISHCEGDNTTTTVPGSTPTTSTVPGTTPTTVPGSTSTTVPGSTPTTTPGGTTTVPGTPPPPPPPPPGTNPPNALPPTL
jgi:hypothetical protein